MMIEMRPKTVLGVLAVAVALAGCEDEKSPERNATQDREGETVTTRDRQILSASRPRVAFIGEAIETRVRFLEKGRRKNLRVVFRPTRVVDPARNRLTPPTSGQRWVRIDVSVLNRGPEPFFPESAPIALIDTKGRHFGRMVTEAPWRQLLGRVLTGERERGSLGFLIDDRARLAKLQFSPLVGVRQAATWRIGSRR